MSDLAKRLRAKYPGAYDDMDDASLEKAVLAKHPEYADLAQPEPKAAPAESQGDLGHYAGYKRIGDAVVSGLKTAYHHPIEMLGGLGAAGAVAATAPVSVPATLAAAALGGAGGAGLGMIRNALYQDEDSPTTAAGVVGEMGKQGAMNAAFEGAGALGRGGMSLAKNLYGRALKPTKAVLEAAPAARTGGQVAAHNELRQTGLAERATVGGQGGVQRIRGRIADVNQDIADRVGQADVAGRYIDPIQVAKRATETKAQFANQVAPQADLASIDKVIGDFMSHPSFGTKGGAASIMAPSEAQAMKQGTYRTIKGKAYGEMRSAETEAQKGLARGLKEELAREVPEISGLNLTESQLISLKHALQDRARTVGNADPLKLGEQVLMAGTRPKSALLGLMNRPAVLSRGAIGLNEASKVINKLPTANSMRAALIAAMSGQE
jgi:hypothetical protein